jgi:hypothetical protein
MPMVWDILHWRLMIWDRCIFPYGVFETIVGAPDHWRLEYAFWDQVSWVSEVVDGDDFAGEWTSIAVDANRSPHISYQRGNHLMYAHDASPVRFRGYTYQGAPRDTSRPLAGVTLTLYGYDAGNASPVWQKTIQADASGYFNFYLIKPWIFDVFRLEATAPTGMIATGAWSDDGAVVGSDRVEWDHPSKSVHLSEFYFDIPSPTPTSTLTPTPSPTPCRLYLPVLALSGA